MEVCLHMCPLMLRPKFYKIEVSRYYVVRGSWGKPWLRGWRINHRPLEPEPDNAGGGKNMSKTFSTRALSEIVVVIALSTVLSYIKIYHLPQGGSVTAGSMVPLLWLSLRRGAKVGLLASIVYGIVQLSVEPYIYHPIQVLLDYPVAFGLLGLAGFFRKHVLIGVTIGIFGRFVSHLLSGVIFFAEYAPTGMSPIVYSAIYNGSYLIIELVVSAVLTYIIIKRGLLTIYLD